LKLKKAPHPKNNATQRRDARFAGILCAPLILYLTLLLLLPIAWGIYMSFTNKVIGGTADFIGLANYAELLASRDYWKAMSKTVIYTVAAIGGKVVFGTILALALNVSFRGNGICRALLLIPWSLPNVVVALNWKWIFADRGGIMNHVLKSLGLIDKNLLWLGAPALAMFAIVVADVWRGTPFFGISILGKLQSIPKDLYEAAEIDGANILQRFLYVTLPSIADVIGLTTLVSTIWTINQFETVRIMTNGGPNGATELMNVYSYRTALTNLQLGKGVAISVLSIPVFLVLIYFATKKSLQDE
jgi:multiple sugar transport system permease protein